MRGRDEVGGRRSGRGRRAPRRPRTQRPARVWPRPRAASSPSRPVPSASGGARPRRSAVRGSPAAPGCGRRRTSSAAGAWERRGVRRHRRDVELRILVEDRPLEAAQFRPWLDPELLDQARPRRPVGLERLRLPARAVEREHQLAAQALRQRVLGDQRARARRPARRRGRARDPRRCDPEAPRGEAPRAGRSQPAPTARRRTPPAAGRARARAPRAAARLRLAVAPRASVDQALEAVQIEATGLDAELVAARPRDDDVVAERLAELGDIRAAGPSPPLRADDQPRDPRSAGRSIPARSRATAASPGARVASPPSTRPPDRRLQPPAARVHGSPWLTVSALQRRYTGGAESCRHDNSHHPQHPSRDRDHRDLRPAGSWPTGAPATRLSSISGRPQDYVLPAGPPDSDQVSGRREAERNFRHTRCGRSGDRRLRRRFGRDAASPRRRLGRRSGGHDPRSRRLERRRRRRQGARPRRESWLRRGRSNRRSPGGDSLRPPDHHRRRRRGRRRRRDRRPDRNRRRQRRRPDRTPGLRPPRRGEPSDRWQGRNTVSRRRRGPKRIRSFGHSHGRHPWSRGRRRLRRSQRRRRRRRRALRRRRRRIQQHIQRRPRRRRLKLRPTKTDFQAGVGTGFGQASISYSPC